MQNTECLKHRETLYFDGLDKLLRGEETPEYVHYRWKKLKRIRKEAKK